AAGRLVDGARLRRRVRRQGAEQPMDLAEPVARVLPRARRPAAGAGGPARLGGWGSVRTLGLLVLLSFGLSLAAFNEGDVFTSVPIAYPPLLYLLGRMLWIGFRGRVRRAGRAVWPICVLAAATIFLVGFRIGLNTETSNVID